MGKPAMGGFQRIEVSPFFLCYDGRFSVRFEYGGRTQKVRVFIELAQLLWMIFEEGGIEEKIGLGEINQNGILIAKSPIVLWAYRDMDALYFAPSNSLYYHSTGGEVLFRCELSEQSKKRMLEWGTH